MKNLNKIKAWFKTGSKEKLFKFWLFTRTRLIDYRAKSLYLAERLRSAFFLGLHKILDWQYLYLLLLIIGLIIVYTISRLIAILILL